MISPNLDQKIPVSVSMPRWMHQQLRTAPELSGTKDLSTYVRQAVLERFARDGLIPRKQATAARLAVRRRGAKS